jgi:hypothetical protein
MGLCLLIANVAQTSMQINTAILMTLLPWARLVQTLSKVSGEYESDT